MRVLPDKGVSGCSTHGWMTLMSGHYNSLDKTDTLPLFRCTSCGNPSSTLSSSKVSCKRPLTPSHPPRHSALTNTPVLPLRTRLNTLSCVFTVTVSLIFVILNHELIFLINFRCIIKKKKHIFTRKLIF